MVTAANNYRDPCSPGSFSRPGSVTTRYTQTRREINSLRNYRERWTSGSLFSVNATIQPFKQLCSLHGEGVTDAEQGRDRDGSTRLNLLPMASGKAKPNHVFLSETVGFAQLLYSLAEGTKELFLIDQACLLGDLWLDHHEQISWVGS
jgi:hypothetical protein